jgi:integrase
MRYLPNPNQSQNTSEHDNITLGTILNYAWQQTKDGKAEATAKTTIDRLKQLSTLCNINEPEQVKATLATLTWKNTSKQTVASIYTGYLKYMGKTWTQPHYTIEEALPFIPTEQELDTLIHAGAPKTATLLQLLKETGARIGEAEKLLWTNVDLERKTIYITAEKGSKSRILPISNKLIEMLNRLPKTNNRIFQTDKHSQRTTFEALRNRTAVKLSNPRLKAIHLHTFRHFKATMEYHKTRDIIHVKTVLGHKNIESTMVYINLEQATFLSQADEWTCKATNKTEEATALIENGFEYITTTPEGLMLFRKRK